MPLRTEEYLTDAGIGIDDLSGVERKKTTTVAMDFGRITLNENLVLLPVRHPGAGPVLVRVGRAGPRRARARSCSPTPAAWPTASPSVDYFERRGTPFLVAVNCFDGAPATRSTTCGWRSTSTPRCR